MRPQDTTKTKPIGKAKFIEAIYQPTDWERKPLGKPRKARFLEDMTMGYEVRPGCTVAVVHAPSGAVVKWVTSAAQARFLIERIRHWTDWTKIDYANAKEAIPDFRERSNEIIDQFLLSKRGG